MHKGLRYYLVFILPMLLLANFGYAQKEANIWYFGDGFGCDFNAAPPIALTNGKIHKHGGGASIADSAGNLLFYTDGETVWNKYHDTMPNGTGLFGTASMQPALIVKVPKDKNRYYIFTSSASNSGVKNMGIYYSLVDISANNGQGAVIIKNIRLQNTSSERLAATFHRNNEDIWMATVSDDWSIKNPKSEMYFYLITKSGLKLHHTTNTDYLGGRG